MESFSKRLRRLREEKGLKQTELTKLLNLESSSTISQYEKEALNRIPDAHVLQKLADILSCSVDYLLGRTNIRNNFSKQNASSLEKQNVIDIDKTDLIPVPIYGEIRAGEPILVREEIMGYEYVLKKDIKHGDYFFLKVTGDSMVDVRICEGDLVLVRKQNWLENGDIGVVMVNSEEATIKRYYEQDGLIILKPENRAYTPRAYKPEKIIILGKVVQLRVKIQ